MSSTTIIVRSVNERTTKLCQTLIAKEFDKNDIFIINETPFSSAIKKSFEIGLQQNNKWTLCIDADVLAYPNAITKLIEFGETTDENVFEIQGLIKDKFFFVKRPAGNHLYRTKLIPKAINLIPESSTSLRPESDMLNKMSEIGYPWKQTDIILGLHDFEQYYKDIFRKNMLQAHKHNYLMPILKPIWNEIKNKDFDFQVALWGANYGKIYEKIKVDKNFLKDKIGDILKLKGIEEKKELVLNTNIENTFYYKTYQKKLQEKIFRKDLWNKIHSK